MRLEFYPDSSEHESKTKYYKQRRHNYNFVCILCNISLTQYLKFFTQD